MGRYRLMSMLALVLVLVLALDLAPAIAALQELGYEHQGDLGLPGREAFRYSSPDVPRDGSGREWPTHHLYACLEGNRELRRHLAFRDHLRQHPEQADAYGRLKTELAQQFASDRRAYADAKTEFVLGVLDRIDPALK